MTTKKGTTPSWVTKALAFIATASAEGLEYVMVGINKAGFADGVDPNGEIGQLVNKDAIDVSAARISAAEETGVAGYDAFGPQLESCTSLPTLKRITHAVDLRLKSLPEDQRGNIVDLVNSAGTSMEALRSQMSSLGVDSVADLPGGVDLAALFGDGFEDEGEEAGNGEEGGDRF